MNWPFTVGRVLFVVIFVVFGVQKLIDVPGTANKFAEAGATLTLPAAVTDVTAQIVEAVNMPMPQILAIAAGIIEVAGGLLIAFNVLARTAAVVLLLYTAVTTFFFHDFWNLIGAEQANQLMHAMKNISIIGALLMIAAWPRRRVIGEAPGHERVAHDL